MERISSIDYLAKMLVIIGALNWGLIGFFQFNLVAALFGNMTTLSRIVYALVGLAAIWTIYLFFRMTAVNTSI